jgi:hypothetical protein
MCAAVVYLGAGVCGSGGVRWLFAAAALLCYDVLQRLYL